MRRTVLVLATVAFAIGAPLGAGAAASSSGVQPTSGTLAGTLLDTEGQPVPGICVDAWQGNTNEGPSGISDQNGNYQIAGLSGGDYLLDYFACGSGAPNVQAQFYGNTQYLGSSPAAHVSVGQTTQLQTQTMQPGGSISLHILDSGGNAVVGLHVQALAESFNTPDIEAYVTHWEQTDGSGTVTLKNLLALPYELSYQSCPHFFCAIVGYYQGQPWNGSPTLVTAIPGQVLDRSDKFDVPTVVASTTTMTAQPAQSVVGQQVTFTATVTDADGSVPTGQVRFSLPSATAPEDAAWVPLDADGKATYTSTQLPVGTHMAFVYYEGAGLVAPSEGGVTVDVQPVSSGGGSGGGGGGGGGGAPVSMPVSGTVTPGGSLSSDPAGTVPDASNPLVVGVTSPTGGNVSIDKTPPNTSVAHYQVLNVGATITAPAASASSPLKLSFEVFDGQLPPGSYASDLTVFRDGTPIGACAKAGTATPDPCVTSTSTINGVTTINVLSSHASTWDVEAAQVGRIGGADRIATAVAVSEDSFPTGNAGAVVLARADDYPDALVGAPLAAAKNAPLLLTQGAQLPKATSDEITRVLPAGGTVYVLGGTAAVPDSVVNQLKSSGLTVVREAGADRYATAVAVATELGNPTTVLLATGTNFPDALAAGPAAAHLHGVVLLTAGSVLPTATSTYLSAHAGSTYAVGGPAVKADPAATPLAGADRFATAATVASTLFASPAMVGIATGQAFPDALSGGAQLARADAPLLLATKTTVPAPTSGYLTDAGANLHTIHLFGGPAVLADTLLTPLQALTN